MFKKILFSALTLATLVFAGDSLGATKEFSYRCPDGRYVTDKGVNTDCPTNISDQRPGDDLTGTAVNSQAALSQTGGTLYVCVYASASADPSCDQVLVGTDGDDEACVSAKNTSISTTVEVFSGADRHTGLTVQTEYKASFCSLRNGKKSKVRTTEPFSTQPINTVDLGIAGKYFRVDDVDTFPVGVTLWHSFQSLTTGQMDTLLAQIAADGFKVVQGPILLNRATGLVFPQAGPDDYTKLGQANGAYPFTALSSSSFTLNETYWSHVDHWIDQAGAEGLFVVVTPVWGPMIDEIFSTYSNYLAFVEAVVQRYSDCTYCIWQVAGEYQKLAWQTVANDDTELSAAELQLLSDAVDAVDTNKSINALTAFHPDGQTSTSEDWEDDARIDYLALQSYQSTNHAVTALATDFASSSGKPVWQMEISYEDQVIGAGPDTVTPWEVRMGAYHSFLGGAAAYSYGNTDMWDDSSNPISHITDVGYVDITDHFIPFVNSYHKVAPNHGLVVAGQGSSADGTDTYISAAVYGAAEGILAYTSKGNTFSLNTLSALGAGTLTAEWINPRDGTTSSAGTPTSGTSVEFNPPGSPAEDNDYILRVYIGSPVAGGTDLTGKCRVVDSVNGNDNNTGATPAQAWKTLNKVNSSVTAIGEDVCLMAGSSWNERLIIDWGGSSGDMARAMGVYVDSGDGNKLVKYAEGTGSGKGAKPHIGGDLNPTCIAAGNCKGSGSYYFTGMTVPNGYSAQVEINSNWVVVSGIEVSYVAGIGIQARGGGNGPAFSGTRHHVVVEDNTVEWCGKQCIVFINGVQDSVIRRNNVKENGHCYVETVRAGLSFAQRAPICDGGAWGGAVLASRNWNGRNLIEQNYVVQVPGEAIGSGQGSTHQIIRGNIVGETHSTSIYTDMTSYQVLESNIIWGNSAGSGFYTSGPFGGSMAANVETNQYGNNEYNVFRNNIYVNPNLFARANVFSGGADTAGRETNLYSYGNTGVAIKSYGFRINRRLIEAEAKGNILHFLNNSPGEVCSFSNVYPGYTFTGNYNYYSVGASFGACSGANDIVGGSLNLNSVQADWTNSSTTNPPVVDDFRLGSGSVAIGAGDPSLKTADLPGGLTSADFGTFIWDYMEYPFPVDTPTKRENWSKKLFYDFEGTERGATPDMGALEYAP